MKRLLFLLCLFSSTIGFAQTLTGDAAVLRKTLNLRGKPIDSVQADTSFVGKFRSLPTADAVARFVTGRMAGYTPGGGGSSLQQLLSNDPYIEQFQALRYQRPGLSSTVGFNFGNPYQLAADGYFNSFSILQPNGWAYNLMYNAQPKGIIDLDSNRLLLNARLHQLQGPVRMEALAGTGTRMVVTDGDGNVAAQPTPVTPSLQQVITTGYDIGSTASLARSPGNGLFGFLNDGPYVSYLSGNNTGEMTFSGPASQFKVAHKYFGTQRALFTLDSLQAVLQNRVIQLSTSGGADASRMWADKDSLHLKAATIHLRGSVLVNGAPIGTGTTAWAGITGKPTTIAGYGITDAFNGSWVSLTGKPAFSTVATSGSYTDLLNKPALFSGSYTDLTNKPTIPTNTNQLTNGAGFRNTTEVAQQIRDSLLAGGLDTTSFATQNSPALFTSRGAYNLAQSKLSNITGLVTAGTNITRSGSGTAADPYVFNASAGNPSQWTTNGSNIHFNTGAVGLGTTAPVQTLTLGSGSTGYADYKTADQTTNYERFRAYWNGNTYTIATDKGGTGAVRDMAVGPVGKQMLFASNSTFWYGFGGGATTSSSGISIFNNYLNSTANLGTLTYFGNYQTISQSGSAGFEGYAFFTKINSTGTGPRLAFVSGKSSTENRVGSTDTITYSVDIDGNITSRPLAGNGTRSVATDVNGKLTAGPVVSDGTYIPTVTGVQNVGGITPYSCQWLRVGNTVTVSGRVDINVTAATTQTYVRVSLPVSSSLAASNELSGTANPGAGGPSAAVYADSANDAATIDLYPSATGTKLYYFTFTYRVL